jgi:adenylate cyclase
MRSCPSARLAELNAGGSEGGWLRFRIGIHLGDVLVDGDNLYGDRVNIAARLEAMAEAGGICISRAVRDQIRGKVEVLLEDLGEVSVKNIDRPVRSFRVGTQEAPAAEAARPAAPRLPEKPSIAVLPFTNMSGDPEQEFFADGISEDIITALSRLQWLFVIARNSTFTYKGRAVEMKQIGRDLGVRYILEGSVRKAGSRVRVTAQLIEAENGTHVWAERYDRAIEDVFALQV